MVLRLLALCPALLNDVFALKAASSRGLPAGWESTVDPSSGSTYYFNRATGARQWEAPAEAPPLQEGLPSGWEKALDPATHKEYYFNRASGVTQWEPPQQVASAPSAGVDKARVATETASSADGAASRSTASSLPSGWERAVDPASNQTYYFNRATKETQWEPPVETRTARSAKTASALLGTSMPQRKTTGNYSNFDEAELRAYLTHVQKSHPGSLKEEVKKNFSIPEAKLPLLTDADSPVDAAVDLIMDEAELQYRLDMVKAKEAREVDDPEEINRQRRRNTPQRQGGDQAAPLPVAESGDADTFAAAMGSMDKAHVIEKSSAKASNGKTQEDDEARGSQDGGSLQAAAAKNLVITEVEPAAELQEFYQLPREADGKSVVEIAAHGPATLPLPPPPPLSLRAAKAASPASGSSLMRREGRSQQAPAGNLLQSTAVDADSAHDAGSVASAQAQAIWSAMQANSSVTAGQSPGQTLALSACVWKECGFANSSHCFSGTTGCTNVDSFGMEKDISSLMTGDGYKIKVFSQPGCTGSWLWLARYAAGMHALECLDQYSFAGQSWDNQVKSLKVCLRDGEC